MDGTIFDIQRLCVQDGPGIRTTVFFKGCPLRCLWCHNPESLSKRPQMIFRAHKCAMCGACQSVCEADAQRFGGVRRIDFEKCTLCGRCTSVCCYDAMELLGKRMSVDEVAQSVLIDRPYFGDDGGVTLSGGEPMAQFPFALALAKRFKQENVHVAMETSGYAQRAHFEDIAPHIELFLFDYKATGAALHEKLTGVNPSSILSNLYMLNDLGKHIILRCPMIPGLNDSRMHLQAIAALAQSLECVREVHILPYHRIGETKRTQLGGAQSLPEIAPPDAERTKQWIRILRELGCDAKLI